MLNIDRIEKIIKKKDQKRNKIVTFLFGTCLNQLSKILNNGYRQGPSFYLFLKHQQIKKKNERTERTTPNEV